jgi:flagellin-like protein
MFKRGFSGVIAALILVAMVLVVGGITFGVVRNIVNEGLESASCVDVIGKVSLGSFTCYDKQTMDSGDLYVQVEFGDVDISKLLVSVEGGGSTQSFDLYEDVNLGITGVTNYDGTLALKFPKKNSGKTYIFDTSSGGIDMNPNSVKISPFLGEQQCGVSDQVFLESCGQKVLDGAPDNPPPLTETTVDLIATEINSGNIVTNNAAFYGCTTAITVGDSWFGSFLHYRSFLSFDTSSIDSDNIINIELIMTTVDLSSLPSDFDPATFDFDRAVEIRGLSSADPTCNINNMELYTDLEGIGETSYASVTKTSGGWTDFSETKTIDLSGAESEWNLIDGEFNIGIKRDSELDIVKFISWKNSADPTNPPKLRVTYQT